MRRAQAAGLAASRSRTDFGGDAACMKRPAGPGGDDRADHESGSDRIFEPCAAWIRRAGGIIVNLPGRSSHPGAGRHRGPALLPLADPAVDIGPPAGGRTTDVSGTGRPQRGPRVVGSTGHGRAGSACNCARAVGSPAAARPVSYPLHPPHSESTPTGAPRSPASSACPPPRSSSVKGSSSWRALEAGMRIDVTIVDSVPLGVDTPADLAQARDRLGGRR